MFTPKELKIMADALDNVPIQGTLRGGIAEFLHDLLITRQKVQAIIEGNITLVQKETPPNEEDHLASN